MTPAFHISGYPIFVDAVDMPLVSAHHWQIHKTRNNIYLRTTIDGHYVKIHRLLMGVVSDRSVLVDHRDGNGLNNSRQNLRVCNNAQNTRNMRKKTGSSVFKGVFLDKRSGKWRAEIGVDFKKINLGRFVREIDAAVAYDSAASKYHGEFARLNFPAEKPALQEAA